MTVSEQSDYEYLIAACLASQSESERLAFNARCMRTRRAQHDSYLAGRTARALYRAAQLVKEADGE